MDVKQALKIWSERNERMIHSGFPIMMHDSADIEEAGQVIIDDQQKQIDRLGAAAKVAVDMIRDSSAERDEARRDAVEMAHGIIGNCDACKYRLENGQHVCDRCPTLPCNQKAAAIIAKYEKGEGDL